MKPAVLFDLGNTLAAYYHTNEFQPILRRSISAVSDELASRGLLSVSLEAAFSSAQRENVEAADLRFNPMIERFERIFRFSLAAESALALRLCERFLGPIFEVGRVYEDTPHVLASLRSEGHQLAVVSNAPWGSPPQLWREELQRLGLAELVDTIVLCGDVGRRKPAPQIFAYAATALDRTADQCIFVGDDLRWDISGSKAVGMRPILVDRDQRHNNYTGERVASPDRARSRAVRARSVGVDCMESRTFLLLQAIIAFCLWALVPLIFWSQLLEIRTKILSDGVYGISGSAMLSAVLLICLEVVLLAIAIWKVCQYVQGENGESR